MTDETDDIEETRATPSTSNEIVVPSPASESSPYEGKEDVMRTNSLPPELSQMQCQVMRDDEELPTSSAASVPIDDFSSITSYSIFSKEQRRRRQLKVDTEVPTNPEQDDVAIPAVVDLPHIQDLQPLPSLVSLGNVGSLPSKELVRQAFFGGLLPDWIRESPGWIKRILLLCLFLLLAALFLILAVASRDGSASNDNNPSRTSIGLEDIPANTPTDLVPTPSPTVGSPVSWPPAISWQQEYPTYSPVAWQAGMPSLLSPSPTLTRPHSEAHRTSSPTSSLLKTIDLIEETDDIGDFWELPPLRPSPPPSVSRSMKSQKSKNKGAMNSNTKHSMKGGMDNTKKLSKKSKKTSKSMKMMAKSEEQWQKQGR